MAGRLFSVLVALAAVVVLSTTGARASCAVDAPLQSVADEVRMAKVVFVGSVVYTTDNNRTARVRVESIWKGPRLPPYVDVHGEAPGSGPFSASEADRLYQTGQRYLFLPLNARPPFQDYGECTFTSMPLTADLASAAPVDAIAPDSPTIGDAISNFIGQYSQPLTIVVVLVAAAALIGLLRRSRRTTGTV